MWYVQAGAPTEGIGSKAQPFNSLAVVERESGPGDRIVVLPAPITSPLDGGIELKAGQQLVGASTGNSASPDEAPIISNSTADHLSGDAIRLASDTEVSGIVIRHVRRGAIYGVNVTNVRIMDNDVSDFNLSCTEGFEVQPFVAPVALPFIGMAVSGPQNGWAAVMIDEGGSQSTLARLVVSGNKIHDGACGDGIDVRASGHARVDVAISGNLLRDLAQGASMTSVLGIGIQARDNASVRATQRGNEQRGIGSVDADCEGQFANTAESGRIVDAIDQNTFTHGIGGSSCNGFEAIISNGDGSLTAQLTRSRFTDVPGDIIQAPNLGRGSSLALTLDHVVAQHSTFRGGTSPFASDPGTSMVPFNLGDCVLSGASGASSSTRLAIRNSQLLDCNSGVTIGADGVLQNGLGPVGSVALAITNSRIAGHAHYGVQVLTGTPLDLLQVRIERSEIRGNAGYGFASDALATGTTRRIDIDLGGGVLSSAGGNWLSENGKADVESSRYEVYAYRNWWGQLGGPLAGQLATKAGGIIRTEWALPVAP